MLPTGRFPVVTKKLRKEQKNWENASQYTRSGRARNALHLSAHQKQVVVRQKSPAYLGDLPFLAENAVPREVNGWTLATNSRS
jgi:hypothetical protein